MKDIRNSISIIYSFPFRIGTAGTGMTAWYQVRGLLHQGVRVSLFCGSCESPLEGLTYLREILKPLGLKLPIRVLGVKKAAALHDKIVARALRREHNKIDLVHCWPSGAKETLKVARTFGIKSVLERPNTHTRYAFEVVTRECKKLGIKLPKHHPHVFDTRKLKREEEEFDLADRLLCPSRFVARTFLDLGFKEEKIARHQYGFDPEFFSLPDGDRRQDTENFKMIFVGSCEPRKGLNYAVDAWLSSEASKKGVFYICGNFIPSYKKLLAGKLSHPSIKEVRFNNNVGALMQNCHALILPSIEEGSALVTYEARGCGCVLLVSEATGAICEHMKDAIVHAPGDVDSLREHIDMLASDKSLYRMLQKNSLAGLDQLTWEKAAETLVDIYRQTLNSSSA